MNKYIKTDIEQGFTLLKVAINNALADIENGEETVKSLEEKENVSIEDQKVTVTIKKDVNIDTVQDILQQAIQIAHKSQKSVNDETYAQKTAKLEKTLGEMNEFIDKVNNPEDDKQDNGKKGEEE